MSKCVVCISKEVKSLLREHFNDSDLNETLEKTPECENDVLLESCPKNKRTRTAYQEFVSKCMKAKNIQGFGQAGPALKECAAEWKRSKLATSL